jgi:hypothetical protein
MGCKNKDGETSKEPSMRPKTKQNPLAHAIYL